MMPKYNEMYRPLLECLSDKKPVTNKEIADRVAESFHISKESRKTEVLPSGSQVFSNRLGWALTYLKKAGLIIAPKRGTTQITEEGFRVWKDKTIDLTNEYLKRYPAFIAFYGRKNDHQGEPGKSISGNIVQSDHSPEETPSDLLEQAFASINDRLADELMTEIMAKDSTFFEWLVVKLLLKMGYGGSASDAGVVTQKSNDGGIDGIIREDKLGFDQIYIQAKRWDPDTTVNKPEIHKFSGALQDKGASKGLFITTAKFSEGAKESAEKQHIVLVDGIRLTKLMIEYNLGVSPVTTYQVKTIDIDFFSDDND